MAKVTLKNRVEAGAKFLDVMSPGWEKKIDLSVLDLGLPNTCVLGEIFGNYEDGKDALGIEEAAAEGLGFQVSGDGVGSAYTRLTNVWKEFIKNLLKN